MLAGLWLRILVCFLDREYLGFAAAKKGEMLAELMPRYVIGIEKP